MKESIILDILEEKWESKMVVGYKINKKINQQFSSELGTIHLKCDF